MRASWLLVFFLLASLSLGAQNTPADRAYNNGYDAGNKLGVADAKAGRPADYSRSLVYRRATDGWDAGLGGREQYRENFRAGFRDGYHDGHREGRGSAPAQVVPPPAPRVSAARAAADEAFSTGYKEGFPQGQRDAGGNYRATETSLYRDATHGYEAARHGPVDDYKFNFRQGYEAGYDDGYNGRASNPRRDMPRTFGRPAAAGAAAPAPAPAAPAAPARGAVSVGEGTVLRLRLNNTISTRSSRQGDRFTAAVTEPVYVSGSSAVAIPVGSTVTGFVAHVQRPGRVSGTAELQLHYETLALPGGPQYNLQASTSGVQDSDVRGVEGGEGTVEGQKTTGRDAAKVGGGAALGAIIGGIAGGGKGAGIGAAIGAGAGLGGVLATRGKEIDLPSGTIVQVRLNRGLEIQR